MLGPAPWAFALLACRDPAPNPFVTTTPTTVVRAPALVFDGPPPRHLVFLSIDTLRRDRFGPTSADGVDHLPFLAARAAEGVTVTDVVQCSNWTYGSTNCTLAGQYPDALGFLPSLAHKIDDPANWAPPTRTLAARLTDAGYHTVLVSSNTWLGPNDNNVQGYTEFWHPDEVNAAAIAAEGLLHLEAAADADWFLHLHFIEPHPAYDPPEAYLAEEAALPPLDAAIDLADKGGHYDATSHWPDLPPAQQANLEAHLWARYHGELRWLDDQLAEAWTALDAGGWLDDTLVVVWSDHGEQFFERGDQSHAYDLNAEENDGVLFFWARNLRPGAWTETAHAVDIVPTVLSVLGQPQDPALPGEVLGMAPVHRALFAFADARNGLQASVVLDGWRLVYDFGGKVRMYDRNRDRAEQDNVLARDPDDPHLAPLWDALLPRVRGIAALDPDRPPVAPDGLEAP